MKARMYQLFYIDERARLTMYAVSGGIAFFFGLAAMVLGSEVRESAVGSAILMLVILTAWTLAYCWSKTRVLHEQQNSAHWALPTRRLALAASVLFASVLAGITTKKVEAAVINKKLKRYADKSSLEEQEIRGLTTTLNYAQENALKVNSVLLTRVGIKLATLPATGYHQAAQVVAALQSEIITVPVNPSMRYSQIFAPNISADFSDMSFGDSTVLLDANKFVNCLFVRCLIRYGGGPLTLRGTTFVKCEFEISNSEQGRKLLAQLVKGKNVDFKSND